jgi:hypothetical protein
MSRKAILATVALFAVTASVSAQQPVRIPAGTYHVVPDSTYAADFDATGIVSEVTATTMTTTQAGTLLVRSNIAFEGDVMSFSDVDGQFLCPGVAKYRVILNAKGFRVVAVDDPCPERAGVLNQVSFVRAS